ncbi:hypothetical protein RHMOL_Rhmol03G0126800 [Rhododendron molle]|uniref:Uncharacterized protein n=1 Tax=Rhododendron molle TaxID=49168 RepID=A0ACC0PDV0_RHOML|nr:hypothetical protein RHMOL_Rhmol03G0126800 [Rhododendron molle]
MAGTVYYIWKAKNDSIFGNNQCISDSIYEQIVKDVRDRVFFWRNCGRSSLNSLVKNSEHLGASFVASS